MIASALIAQCRREYHDEPVSVSVQRAGNASVNLFNSGKFPIVEGSYIVYVSGVMKNDVSDYTYDLDNGDLRILSTPGNGIMVRSDHKYAIWRDKNWVEAQNQAIDTLNARGFFRQVVRNTSIITLSAGITTYSGPSACIDIYEFLVRTGNNLSGNFVTPGTNWSYQQDANKLVLGSRPTTSQYTGISYLRNLQTYSATSATLDVLPDWVEAVKKKTGAIFFRSLAAKIAKQGNANVDEGHFSFTNLRTMANDLDNDFENLVKRKKPTRPAKDMQYHLETGGVA